ncbi:hypothetical protein [Bacterioplanoides sp.]|uniref:hypothetical protein n=1 Tax=Bacterioplanoides sp. TaxID=2066072 RepID=UPI003B5AD8EC
MIPDMSVTYDAERAAAINQQLVIRSLSATSRKRILKNTGRVLLKESRDHIRQQQTLSGKSMEKRKYGRGKVLKKMGKTIKFFANTKNVRLTWTNRAIAKLASRHQFGIPEVFDALKMENIHGKPDYQQPASRKQAKALLNEGFRVTPQDTTKKPRKGKTRKKKPSQKWIMENMKMGQAALVIRKLRKEERPPKTWKVKVPARPFLGVMGGDASQIISDQIEQERQRRSNGSPKIGG